MSFRTTGATNVWEGFCRNNATAGRRPPDPYPCTVMWWVYIDSLVATYASFMLMGPLNWEFGPNNWIASIGPFGPGAANAFAMSANGSDNDTGVLLSGMTGRWLCQAIRTRKDGSNAIHEYYPDLLGKPRTFGVQTIALPYFSGVQSNTLFFMGCPPWADQEGLNGKIGGVKIWRTWLPHGAILQERGSAYPVLRQYSRQIYGVYPARQAFKNLNSSSGGNDILFDVSGNGNHFYQSTSADNYAAGDTGGCESWGDAPIVQTPPARAQDWTRRLFIASISSGVSAALTGQSIASAPGTLAPDLSKALSGQAGTLEQGTAAPALSLALGGQAASLAQGTEAPAISIALSGQSIAIAQGTISASSDITAALIGSALTASPGTLSPELSLSLAGQLGTLSTGTLTPVIGVFVELTGLALTASTGTLTGVSVELPGQALQKPAGRKRRHKRLLVELDGQDFEVESVDQAVALLDRAKEIAVAQIAKVRTSPLRVEHGIKRPSIRTDSAPLRELVREKRAEIVSLYDQLLRDLEIQHLMAKADEDDEEETLIRLLM